ncbi:hypothetical protein L3Q82_005234 [Scortum barcoo]|uniref:Uncharacterized protein n=1 Tax=Scortum barcoo TaxID=214431 RepID=A0ACB8V9R9_9TELE|nr:hypothetical protein L3Q82_005234 [Scortum barcoo]
MSQEIMADVAAARASNAEEIEQLSTKTSALFPRRTSGGHREEAGGPLQPKRSTLPSSESGRMAPEHDDRARCHEL